MSEDDMIGLLRSAIFSLEVCLYGGMDEATINSAVEVLEELRGAVEELGGIDD